MALFCARLLALLGGLALATGQSVGAAPREVVDLLEAVPRAVQGLSYQGDFVYAHGGHLDAMRIVHRAAPGVGAEKLVSLSGPEREVVRQGEKVTSTFNTLHSVLVERRQPRDFVSVELLEPVASLERYYAFTLMGDDRVAGRQVRVVRILPTTADRYGHQLWIDRESRLLLRSAVIDQAGEVLEQFMFTSLALGEDIPDASLASGLDGAGFTWDIHEKQAEPATPEGTPALAVGWVPRGFTLQDQHLQQRASGRRPIHQAVYSDGLAVLSIFLEDVSPEEPPLEGFSTLGAVNAFSRVERNHQITVVGEVPQTTVRRVAASVTIPQSPGPGR